MKTFPMLFSTVMVQSIMADIKTQTRRLIKSNHESGMFRVAKDKDGNISEVTSLDWDHRSKNGNSNDIKPICNIGDIIWVRETWQVSECFDYSIKNKYAYRANPGDESFAKEFKISWRPSIFMPKDAARNFLELNKIRVERLHDITEEDAKAEGSSRGVFRMGPNTEKKHFHLEHNVHGSYRDGFKYIWCLINGLESWESNPFVWAYDFKRVDKPENFI